MKTQMRYLQYDQILPKALDQVKQARLLTVRLH